MDLVFALDDFLGEGLYLPAVTILRERVDERVEGDFALADASPAAFSAVLGSGAFSVEGGADEVTVRKALV